MIAHLALDSAGAFSTLAIRGRLHLRHHRLAHIYRAEDGGAYSVFRETASSATRLDEPAVLVVGFRLKLLRSSRLFHWLFQRVCIFTTPFWSGFKGFVTKLWMVDRHSQNYLGIYQWAGEGNARIYVDALVRVLAPLSVRGSVWYRLYPFTNLDNFLDTREIGGPHAKH